MERIMPIDLEQPSLRKGLIGYDRAATDRLLLGAARSLQDVLVENGALRQELERLRADAGIVREQEKVLKEVLVLAQKAADETRITAQRQADVILEEARQSALAERMNCQQKISEMRWDLERLRNERNRFSEEFKALLERHQIALAEFKETKLDGSVG
jgi:cell division initiation protein